MTNALSAHLPEFTVSSTMRTAANTVAASFHAYQQSCYDLPKAGDVSKIRLLLQSQKERKQAYHLALKFLSTAAFKANPDYSLTNTSQLSDKQLTEIKPLLDSYLEQKLNQLIRDETQKNPLIKNIAEHHPVIAGPW